MYNEEQLLLAIGNLLETKLEEKLEQKLEEKLEQKLEEKLDQKLDQKLAPIKADISTIKGKVANLEARTLSIELTLENEIPKRLDSLYDGYKMNRELIEKVKDMAEDTNAMVTALDVAKFVHADNGKNLKIVK